MRFPSFEELADLVRASVRLKENDRIDPDTQLRDLKVQGRRGADLIRAVELQFGIQFSQKLRDHFQEPRTDPYKDADESPVIRSLLGVSGYDDAPWTVGRLYRAVLEEMNKMTSLQESTRR